jgi:hypothetical protein
MYVCTSVLSTLTKKLPYDPSNCFSMVLSGCICLKQTNKQTKTRESILDTEGSSGYWHLLSIAYVKKG